MFSLWGRSEISTRRMIWLGHRSLYGVAVKPKPNSYKLWQYVCICSAVLWTPSFEYQCVKKPFVLRSLMPFIMRGGLSNLLLKHQNRLFISFQSKPPNTFVNHFDDLSGWSHCLLKCSVEPSNLFSLLCILEINCPANRSFTYILSAESKILMDPVGTFYIEMSLVPLPQLYLMSRGSWGGFECDLWRRVKEHNKIKARWKLKENDCHTVAISLWEPMAVITRILPSHRHLCVSLSKWRQEISFLIIPRRTLQFNGNHYQCWGAGQESLFKEPPQID